MTEGDKKTKDKITEDDIRDNEGRMMNKSQIIRERRYQRIP